MTTGLELTFHINDIWLWIEIVGLDFSESN